MGLSSGLGLATALCARSLRERNHGAGHVIRQERQATQLRERLDLVATAAPGQAYQQVVDFERQAAVDEARKLRKGACRTQYKAKLHLTRRQAFARAEQAGVVLHAQLPAA